MNAQDRDKYRQTRYIDPRKPFILDQIAIEIPVEYLNIDYKSHYEKNDFITITEPGGKKWIHFHDICFKYDQSIVLSIHEAIQKNLYFHDYPLFCMDISYQQILDDFPLRVLEIAFDTYHEIFPYYINFYSGSLKATNFPNKPVTIYTTDYRKATVSRKTMKDSLIDIYDRANKIGVTDQKITRLEYRIKNDYMTNSGLKTSDLDTTPMKFSGRVKPLLITLTKWRLVPHSFWPSNAEILKLLHPYLYDIMQRTHQTSPNTNDYINRNQLD